MDEPAYRVWMQDSVPPSTYHAERPGRWVAEPSWPSPSITLERFALNIDGLSPAPGREAPLTHRSPLSNGALAGHWCAYGYAPDLPADQRADDGKSLVFDSAPLAGDVEILGPPIVTLELAVDRPQAQVCVRLNDVDPSGASLRVTYGLLNLAHRDGHEFPTALEPGRRYAVSIQLNDVAHAFPAGHRIRVAISTSYWPIAWPSPELVTLTLYAGASRLLLPVRPRRSEDARLRAFPPAEALPSLATTEMRAGTSKEFVTHDLVTGESVFTTDDDDGCLVIDHIALATEHARKETFRITDDDPSSATADIASTRRVSRDGWRTRTETRTIMRATTTEFVVDATLDAFEGDTRIFSRNWHVRHKRDFA
jgi:hypothetical protein